MPFLVDHFLGKYGTELGERAIATEALERLMGYGWPGNVRELENVIQHAMVMAGGGVILPEHLPIAPGGRAAAGGRRDPRAAGRAEARGVRPRARPAGVGEPLRSPDRAGGAAASPRGAARDGGNQLRAAALLGINRNTLRKKLRQLGLAAGSPDS